MIYKHLDLWYEEIENSKLFAGYDEREYRAPITKNLMNEKINEGMNE